MKSIAIITARGGSKRIPGKNIKNFCGKPIIAYSIEAALKSEIFDSVMVSTDDEEIADIAKKFGAEVPFLRSPETSNDYATTADVIAEVLHEYQKLGQSFGLFACLYPTAPFITATKLKSAMETLLEQHADGLVSVTKYSFPPQRAFVIRNGELAYQYPQFEKTRSQDLEPIYHDCGQFYFCSYHSFVKHHSMIIPHSVPFIISEEEVQDIDTMSDWLIAEAKYKALQMI